ncbi:MAG: phosphoenolpyruvate--protein phosphotransferase [Blautia sp.]|nr:phosphoenolpyruvate--protein phosphotransferase [Blautia sp.]
MEIFNGTPTFDGIAVGHVRYYSRGEFQLRQYLISNVNKEFGEFEAARDKVAASLEEMAKATEGENDELSAVNRRQIALLLGDAYTRAIEHMVALQKVSAQYAVMTIRDELKTVFGKLEDTVAKERIRDVVQVSSYILEALGGVSSKIELGEEPMILVAERLSLTELMEMDRDKILAVVTNEGSEISHGSIFARTIGVPSLVGIDTCQDWDGQMAIVDAYSGTLYISPDEDELKEYERRKTVDEEERAQLLRLRTSEDRTADGKEVKVYANIGNLDDLGSVLYYGAAGIGLLRSEFQYLGRDGYPREKELFLEYKKVAQTMGDKPVVIRTVDLGGDKCSPYLKMPEERNPIMGNRGIRLCLDRRRMFRAQLRAIYRASAYGKLSVMFPMITSLEEVDEILGLIEEVKESLRGQFFREIPIGIMVETPAAVMMAGELAAKVDFLSLGTNDLTQYTLAMDRQNPALRKKFNANHPAVMRMIQWVVDAAHANGKKVTLCGELAADTNLTGDFLRMGVDALSVVPACILPVRKAVQESIAGASPAEFGPKMPIWLY